MLLLLWPNTQCLLPSGPTAGLCCPSGIFLQSCLPASQPQPLLLQWVILLQEHNLAHVHLNFGRFNASSSTLLLLDFTLVRVATNPAVYNCLKKCLFPCWLQSAKGFWKKPALNMIYKSSQIRILDPSITRKTAYEWLRFPTRFPKKEVGFFLLYLSVSCNQMCT